MRNQTLIFIPDISGFTDFVNRTAIEHSQHIISELLEIIVDSNELDFSISEIEGDAVLFYKHNEIPPAEKIIAQSKEMFLRFHSHLKEIENTNVCQCGACKSASNLSLKLIVHLGEIKEVRVGNFNKLIGSDLILAHRLLKNQIKKNEYLLFSDAYFNNFSSDQTKFEDWVIIEKAIEDIDKFGQIEMSYVDFEPLLAQVKEFVNYNKTVQHKNKPDISITIEAPILLVHDSLTDAEAKYEFVPGIKKIVTDDKINRVNSSHTCVFDNLEIHFVTKSNTVEKRKITYSEEAELPQGLKFITDYRLTENGTMTNLDIYIFKPKLINNEKENILKRIKDYFLLNFIKINNKKGIKHFKDYCERKYKETFDKGV